MGEVEQAIIAAAYAYAQARHDIYVRPLDTDERKRRVRVSDEAYCALLSAVLDLPPGLHPTDRKPSIPKHTTMYD
jgi:hypothetical protein